MNRPLFGAEGKRAKGGNDCVDAKYLNMWRDGERRFLNQVYFEKHDPGRYDATKG